MAGGRDPDRASLRAPTSLSTTRAAIHCHSLSLSQPTKPGVGVAGSEAEIQDRAEENCPAVWGGGGLEWVDGTQIGRDGPLTSVTLGWARWEDGLGHQGHPVPPGSYFYALDRQPWGGELVATTEPARRLH